MYYILIEKEVRFCEVRNGERRREWKGRIKRVKEGKWMSNKTGRGASKDKEGSQGREFTLVRVKSDT